MEKKQNEMNNKKRITTYILCVCIYLYNYKSNIRNLTEVTPHF